MKPIEDVLGAELLDEYEVVRELGVGGQGRTALGRPRRGGPPVVLKTLDFVQLSSWKDLELLQREMRVLRSLDHPAVPKLHAFYPEGEPDGDLDAFVVVQEYIEGEPLDAALTEAEAPILDEAAAIDFLGQMLEILEYLHGLNPPVVHRDIKPSNIIRNRDGRYVLIDFGASRASGVDTGSSTFVGTNGYMPPEQLMGRAEPRSDLFALGATTLELMTAIEPCNLAREDLSFRLDVLTCSEHLRHFLAVLTNPSPVLRYGSASRAREALANRQDAMILGHEDAHGLRVERTADGRVVIHRPPRINKAWAGFAAFFLFLALALAGGATSLTLLGVLIGTQAIESARLELNDRELLWRRSFATLSVPRRLDLATIVDAEPVLLEAAWAVVIQRTSGAQVPLRARGMTREQAMRMAFMINNHLEAHR